MSTRLLALLLLVLPALFGQDPLSRGEELYRRTEYSASLAIVAKIAKPGGAAYALAGRNYFMLGDYKKAAEAFQKALALDPAKSEYAHWLGRSFARRAETSAPFLGSMYASKARAYFEKAVALDPNNEAALRDLFDYYLEAPGFRGGGYDKAQAIAQRIAERNPAEGQYAQSELAGQRKQFDTAEEQLRGAMALSQREVGRVLDLARYLAKRGLIQESEAMFDKAEQLAPNSPKVDRGNLTPDDPRGDNAEKLVQLEQFFGPEQFFGEASGR
jgi:Flp pilus assembly protein TadD